MDRLSSPEPRHGPGPQADQQREAAERLRGALRQNPGSLIRSFHEELFSAAPDLADRFPPGLGGHRGEFVRMLEHVLDSVAAGSDPPGLVALIGQLGRDHRKHQLTEQHYQLAQAALAKAFIRAGRATSGSLREADLAFADRVAGLICQVMSQEARRDPNPPFWEAQVVERLDYPGPTAVIRLLAVGEPPFAASQYVSVQIPQRPGHWRYLSPAVPPNERGEVEFHVRAVPAGTVSPAVLAHTKPGDRWRLSPGYGSLGSGAEQLLKDQVVLMVAADTGLAPLRALLLAMALRVENPRVAFLFGARSRAELYDLGNLRALARESHWLNALPVVDPQSPSRPPWSALVAAAVEFAPNADLVLLSGPDDMVLAATRALRSAGVPAERVRHDPTT